MPIPTPPNDTPERYELVISLARKVLDNGLITAAWTLGDREYWLCEGAVGAAGRPGRRSLQCWRARYPAAGLIPNVERRSRDAVTWCSAEHRSDTKGNEDTQATASDLGAGLDQQEVRRSATSAWSTACGLWRVQALHHHLPRRRAHHLGRDERPGRRGPFPVLVLNHGYIDPDTYFPGQGMPREHDYLARHGYVVLHTDYRGHTSSDNDKDVDYELRLPYAVDTINAVLAVKSSKLRFLDKDQVGWLGRSMGGGVVERARGPAGPRRCRRHLRFRGLDGRRQLEAVLPTIGGSVANQPTDGADVQAAEGFARILARCLSPRLFRSGV